MGILDNLFEGVVVQKLSPCHPEGLAEIVMFGGGRGVPILVFNKVEVAAKEEEAGGRDGVTKQEKLTLSRTVIAGRVQMDINDSERGDIRLRLSDEGEREDAATKGRGKG